MAFMLIVPFIEDCLYVVVTLGVLVAAAIVYLGVRAVLDYNFGWVPRD